MECLIDETNYQVDNTKNKKKLRKKSKNFEGR